MTNPQPATITERQCTACGDTIREIDHDPQPGDRINPVSCGEPTCSHAVAFARTFLSTAPAAMLEHMRNRQPNGISQYRMKRCALIEQRNRVVIRNPQLLNQPPTTTNENNHDDPTEPQ